MALPRRDEQCTALGSRRDRGSPFQLEEVARRIGDSLGASAGPRLERLISGDYQLIWKRRRQEKAVNRRHTCLGAGQPLCR